MAGLDPAIFLRAARDARAKPGHDDLDFPRRKECLQIFRRSFDVLAQNRAGFIGIVRRAGVDHATMLFLRKMVAAHRGQVESQKSIRCCEVLVDQRQKTRPSDPAVEGHVETAVEFAQA